MVEATVPVLVLGFAVTVSYIVFYIKFWENILKQILDEYERIEEEDEFKPLYS